MRSLGTVFRWLSAVFASSPLLLAACSSGGTISEPRAIHEDNLYAQGDALRPIANGKVTVRVCWLPLDLANETFPEAFAPDIDSVLAETKKWIRDSVEKEWNGRTPLRFVGWKDCGGDPVDFQIRPIGSGTEPGCGLPAGNMCVDAVGTRGTTVWLNIMFGEEIKVASQSMQAEPEQAEAIRGAWAILVPALCGPEFIEAMNNPSEASLSAFENVHRPCLQLQALHEFGHIAGFAHEQNRDDDTAAQTACLQSLAERGLSTGLPDVTSPNHGNVPLGRFDPESVMNYCRTDPRPILSDGDVGAVNQLYGTKAN